MPRLIFVKVVARDVFGIIKFDLCTQYLSPMPLIFDLEHDCPTQKLMHPLA